MTRIGLAAAAGLTLALAGPARAEFVTLRTLDGSVAITGQLAGFADGTYTLSTNIGMVKLSADLVACVGAACPVDADRAGFRLAGSRALADRLMPSLLAPFAAGRGGGRTSEVAPGATAYTLTGEDTPVAVIAAGDSASGLAALLKGEATFAMTARAPSPDEAAAFAARGKGDPRGTGTAHVVALDGLVLAVHPDNPVRTAALPDLARVLSGAARNWMALGGRDRPITLYLGADGTPAREMLGDLVLAPGGVSLAADSVILDDDEAVADALRRDPDGLAVTGFARYGGAALAVGGACGLHVPPTPFTLRTGEYPLARPLRLHGTGAALPEAARAFLEFVASREGQEIVAGTGLVPQTIVAARIHGEGLRLAAALRRAEDPDALAAVRDMAVLLLGAERLSATLRFEPGSAALTARSQDDLFRLAAYLEGEDLRGREIVFAGFTADSGDAGADRDLSLSQSERVRRAVLAAAPTLDGAANSRAFGFGSASPLACADDGADGDGARINARVEIWVRDVDPADGT